MSHLPEFELPEEENVSVEVEDITESEEELIEEEEEEEIVEDKTPIVSAREKLSNDDVFSAPKVKPVKLSREEMKYERAKVREAAKIAVKEAKLQEKLHAKLEIEKKKAEEKAKRPKKTLSPEHLAKLQASRKTAMEQRKRNKELAEKGIVVPNELKTKSEKKKAVLVKEGTPVQSFTKDDLAKAQFEAIETYEKVRKVRKARKKVDQEEKQKLEQSQNIIRKALGQPTSQPDIWDQALAGMWSN
tara:strand:- start:3 stop:737 length:735 start_codon:yes stop_codon:yes gene_type:complete